MILEPVDRRVLAAVRFLDALTGLRVTAPLSVRGEGVKLVRNLEGCYVLTAAPGLQDYTASFPAPPAQPAVGSGAVELTVTDPARTYLPRRCTVSLPRDPDPAHADQAGSLFRPIDVSLFPSPSAPTAAGWAVVRAQVRAQGTREPLAGALIRVLRTADAARLAAGLSDSLADVRGEALVGVPGIPITTWGPGAGAVLATEVDATLEAIYDPTAGPVPDPDDLETRRSQLRTSSTPVKLASGRVLVQELLVPLA
jgi:hypothetical protein